MRLHYRKDMSQFPFGFGSADGNENGDNENESSGFDMNNLGAMFTQFAVTNKR